MPHEQPEPRDPPSSAVSTPTPRLSVVIPCRNGLDYLQECLESVRAAADDSCEVIVVDDGSTEPISDLVAAYAPLVRYVRQENQGPAAARNLGVAHTTGQYIAFVDADDWVLPSAWREQIALLDRFPQLGLVYGQALIVDRTNQVLGMRTCPFSSESYVHDGPQEAGQLMRRNYITTSTTVVRRSVHEQAGPFRADLRVAEDWFQWLKIARLAAIGYVASPVAAYRRHDESTIANQAVDGWRELHYSLVRELYADPDLAAQFALPEEAAFAAQDVQAARAAYGQGRLVLARRLATHALCVSARYGEWTSVAACLSVIMRTLTPKPVRRIGRRLRVRMASRRSQRLAIRAPHAGSARPRSVPAAAPLARIDA